jgi:hypothetical protein
MYVGSAEGLGVPFTDRPLLVSIFGAVLLTLVLAAPALAHDGPEGAEWVMADWIFITFAIFAGGALTVFVVALKAGLLSNLEDAKYHMLTIDEPDYYSGQ